MTIIDIETSTLIKELPGKYVPTFLQSPLRPRRGNGAREMEVKPRKPNLFSVRSHQANGSERAVIEIRAQWNPAEPTSFEELLEAECGPTVVKIYFAGEINSDGVFVSSAHGHAIGVFKNEMGIFTFGPEFVGEDPFLNGPTLPLNKALGLLHTLGERDKAHPHEREVLVNDKFSERLTALIFSQTPEFRTENTKDFIDRRESFAGIPLVTPAAGHGEILPCVALTRQWAGTPVSITA